MQSHELQPRVIEFQVACGRAFQVLIGASLQASIRRKLNWSLMLQATALATTALTLCLRPDRLHSNTTLFEQYCVVDSRIQVPLCKPNPTVEPVSLPLADCASLATLETIASESLPRSAIFLVWSKVDTFPPAIGEDNSVTAILLCHR